MFRAIGHDRWVAIELEDAGDWAVLCRYVDRPDLVTADPAEAATRRAELGSAFAAWAAERTAHTAMHLLQKEGLAVAAVQDSEDIWRDPQLRSRGFMVPLDHPEFGVVNYPRPSHRLSRTPARIRRTPPRLGQHTEEVLRDWLGIDDAELRRLEGVDAVFLAPADGPT